MDYELAENPFSCRLCGYETSILLDLDKHIRAHTEEKNYECDKSFSQSSDLRSHSTRHEKSYKCTECGKSFGASAHLKKHIRTHAEVKNYNCIQCRKPFLTLLSLKKHIKTHTGWKSNKCTECGKSFTVSSSLKRHKKTHEKETKYIMRAEFCKWFSVYNIKNGTITEKNYKCTECGESFPRLGTIIVHINTHIRAASGLVKNETAQSRAAIDEIKHSDEKSFRDYTQDAEAPVLKIKEERL